MREGLNMRIEWDENRCSRTGLCAALAPDVFTIDDSSQLTVNQSQSPDDADEDALRDAADSCPNQAIRILN
jgi:ferredoxin